MLSLDMPCFTSREKRFKKPTMYLTNSVKQDTTIYTKNYHSLNCPVMDDGKSPILPGLPDDVAKYCLALVPCSNFPAMAGVCKKWRSFIQNKEFIMSGN